MKGQEKLKKLLDQVRLNLKKHTITKYYINILIAFGLHFVYR